MVVVVRNRYKIWLFFILSYWLIIGICDTVNCGLSNVCIERSFFENLFYTCGCKNGTNNYLYPGPCPGKKKKKNFDEITMNIYINTDANPITTTYSPGICLNGGK